MAIYDPGQELESNIQPPRTRPSGNDILGSVIDTFAQAGEIGVQTVDNRNMRDISSSIEDKREEIGRMFNEGDVRTYLGGVDNATAEDIIKSGKRLQALGKATRTGAISQMAYDVQVDIATRQLKAKYPGYIDQIDDMIVSKFYGGTPANRIRNEMLAEVGDSENKALERQRERYVSEYEKMGGSSDIAVAAMAGDEQAYEIVRNNVETLKRNETARQMALDAHESGQISSFDAGMALADSINSSVTKILMMGPVGGKINEVYNRVATGTWTGVGLEDAQILEEFEAGAVNLRQNILLQLQTDPNFIKVTRGLSADEKQDVLNAAVLGLTTFAEGDFVQKNIVELWHQNASANIGARYFSDLPETIGKISLLTDTFGEGFMETLMSNGRGQKIINDMFNNFNNLNDKKLEGQMLKFFDKDEVTSIADLVSAGTKAAALILDQAGKPTQKKAAVEAVKTSLEFTEGASEALHNKEIPLNKRETLALSIWDTSRITQKDFMVQPESSLQSTEAYMQSFSKGEDISNLASFNPRVKSAVIDTLTRIVHSSRTRINALLNNPRVSIDPVSGTLTRSSETPPETQATYDWVSDTFGISPEVIGAFDTMGRLISENSYSEKDLQSANTILSTYMKARRELMGESVEEAHENTRALLAGQPPKLMDVSGSMEVGPEGAIALKGNQAKVYSHFVNEYDVKPEIVAGIMGNLMQESGSKLNPASHNQKGEDSWGIVQWNGPRHRAFKQWADENDVAHTDLLGQVDYFMVEMQRDFPKVWAAVQQMDDPEEIAMYLSDKFWRPSDPRPKNRRKYARQIYDSINGA